MRRIWAVLALIAVVAGAGTFLYLRAEQQGGRSSQIPSHKPEHIVINEAVHTLLYLPIYHAIDRGYFRDEGLDVQLVTGGTATNAFSAMTTGHADFAVADPMYVPISREKGADTKVVGQIVSRIAIWALARNPSVQSFNYAEVVNKTVVTHPRPMTAYTYTANYLQSQGLKIGENVQLTQATPGTEVAVFLAGRADFVVTLEPGASTAEAGGGHVVYSWPDALGDLIFTALMTREQTIKQHRTMVLKVIRALYRSFDDLRKNRSAALSTAKKYFPQIDSQILQTAIDRLIKDRVFPDSPIISRASWKRAVLARLQIGDLKGPAPYDSNIDSALIAEARPK